MCISPPSDWDNMRRITARKGGDAIEVVGVGSKVSKPDLAETLLWYLPELPKSLPRVHIQREALDDVFFFNACTSSPQNQGISTSSSAAED